MGRNPRGRGQMITVVIAICLAPTQPSFKAEAQDAATARREFCSVVPGPLGRIVGFSAPPPSKPSARVERHSASGSTETFDIAEGDGEGCYLREGDIVRAGLATDVTVIRTDGMTVTVGFGAPLTMPSIGGVRYSRILWSFIQEVAGGDLSEARNRIQTAIGAIRAGRELPILIRGMIEVDLQRVDRSRPLDVQWEGGSFPFRIELEGRKGARSVPATQTADSERSARFDLASRPSGEYRLTITSGSGTVRRFLDFWAVPGSDVPVAPVLDRIDGQRARELAQAIWLLTKAPSQWRLNALSLLAILAKDHDDPIAKSILVSASDEQGR
jgi:hypothetical protein